MVRRRIGVNLGPPLDFSPNSLVLKDVAKSCRKWFSQNTDTLSPFDTAEALTLRPEDGYPILAAGKAAATLILREMTDTGSSVPLYPGGNYVLTFRGTGRVSVHFDAAFTETTTGHMEFLVTAGTGGILIKIEESDPTDPVHDIKCFQKKYETNLGQPFADEWLDDLSQLSGPIRDLDIGETNFCQLGTFADRCTEAHYTWTLREKGGWPLEMRAKLANALGRDLWSCKPHQLSTADGVSWFKTLQQALDGELFAQQSNETWNLGVFSTDLNGDEGQCKFFQDSGIAQGLGGSDQLLQTGYAYSRATRQLFDALAADADIDMARLTRVVGGWIVAGGGEFWANEVLGFESLGASADMLAIAPYPGTSVFDAGKTAGQMAQEAHDDVPVVAEWIDRQKVIADSFGLDLGFYEGGHGVESGSTADGPLVTAVHDDALSERLTAELWGEAFYRAGPNAVACSFMAYGRGWAKPFGHKRFPGQDASLAPKWRGLAAFAQGGKGGIRVQNGTVSFGASSTTATVTLATPVDLEKAFVRVTNIASTSHGQTGGQASSSPLRDLSIEVELTDEDTLTFTRLGSAAAVDHEIQWEVVAYEGPAGGDYEFKVRGVGKATLPNGTAELRVDLSDPISQPLRCAAFRTFLSCDSASNPYGAALSTVDVDPSTEELVVKRSATSVEVDIGYCVVEFMGSAWAVARDVHEFSAANTLETVGPLLAAQGQTFMFASQRIQAGQNGLDEIGFLMAPVGSNLQARLRLGADNVAAGGYEIVVFQVAAADLFVQHGGTLLGTPGAGSGDSFYTAPLATALDSKHRAMANFTAETNSGTAEHPRASWSGQLRVAGAFRADRSYTGEASDIIYNVVEFPDPDVGEMGGEAWIQLSATGELINATPSDGSIAGEATIGISASGELIGRGEVSGPASIGISAAGTLVGTGRVTGEAVISLGATGELVDATPPTGSIGGTASITISASGELVGVGLVAGEALISISAAGSLVDANASGEPADPGAPSQQLPQGGGPNPGAGLGGFIGADGTLVPIVGTDTTPALAGGRASAAVRRAARAKRQLRLTADRRKLIGWSDATISSSLESVASSFSLRGQSSSFGLRVGAEVQLSFDDQLLMLGWADAVKSRLGDSSQSLEVTGRDRCGDLVDGSIALSQSEFVGQTVEGIAKALCAPHFIAVVREADVGAPFDRFALQPGESAWAAIERACRLRGVLATSNPRGNLVLVKPGAVRSQVPITFGRNGNGLEADVSGTMQDRFARVIVRGQEPQSEFVEIEEAVTVEATATDAAVRSNRQVVVVADTSLDQSTAQRLAEWEVAMRAARALAITVKLQWWTQGKDGPLWVPNLLVPVQIPQLGVAGEYVVKSTKFTLGNQGEMTELQLVPPDIYEPKPALSAEEPLLEPWWTREEPVEAPLQALEAFE